METLTFLGNVIIFAQNNIHVLLYLHLRKNCRWRIVLGLVLLLLPLPLLRSAGDLSGVMLSLIIGPISVIVYYAPIFRYLLFKDSMGRILVSMFATVSFTHINLIGSYLTLHFLFDMPADANLFIYARIVGSVPYALALPLLYRYVRTPFFRLLAGLDSRRRYLAAVAPCFLYFLGMLTHILFFHYPGEVTVALSLVTIGVIAATYWCLYFAVTQADKNRYLADVNDGAERMADIYESYSSLLEQKETAIRTLRHDFRHSLVVIGDLAEKGDTGSILKQVKSLDAAHMTPAAAFQVNTENVPVKAIVSYYFSRAAAMGVKCTSSVSLPPQVPVSEAELVLLTGNALENSLKAVTPLGDKGYIEVMISKVRECLVFQFRNNYMPQSYAVGNKLGLVSIRLLCNKYDGEMEIKDANNEYELTVILQLATSDAPLLQESGINQ